MPTDPAGLVEPPLARWAQCQLDALSSVSGSVELAKLRAIDLLTERAAGLGLPVPARRSAGGKCHLLGARGRWIALNLARDGDRDLLPALFGKRMFDPADLGEIAEYVFDSDPEGLVGRGREMGLAIALDGEEPASPAVQTIATGPRATAQPCSAPLVVDLSALWAGPLCAHLLHLAGAEVVKVESTERPDALRQGDPAHFALLNGGKANAAFDLRAHPQRLRDLLARADIVIEAARPRALEQWGIFAADLLAQRPGKVWITITGHGAAGDAAHAIGFGDDCSVAGGLTTALRKASGATGFGGDAVADPLTGITAARAAWECWQAGGGKRIALSMSAVTALAIQDERAADSAGFDAVLKAWSQAIGRPISSRTTRQPWGAVAQPGADNSRYASC